MRATNLNTKRTDDRFQNVAVIVNMSAGTAADISDELKQILSTHEISTPNIQLVEGPSLPTKLEDIRSDNTDLLIVYGGDGTCKSGAIAARRANVPLIPLPGGTMNILPKALYGTDKWQEALNLAISETPRWLPCGRINGDAFYVGLFIGEPIVLADVRESIRDGDILSATSKLPDVIHAVAHGDTFDYCLDGRIYTGETNLINITCPNMSHGATAPDAFEFAAVPNLDLAKLFDLGTTALVEGWRNSDLVDIRHIQTFTITGQGVFDVLLDGEPERFPCPISVHLDTKGVQVLAPEISGNP